MSKVVKIETLQKNGVSPSSSSSLSEEAVSRSSGKISPAILFIIIIIAVIFFISGLLHLVVRFLNKQRSSLSSTTNSESQNNNNTTTFQRQLQQLFHLHDSGLDQSFIDSLPVFIYREITTKHPFDFDFDCAVCLCEFSEQDKLRLLPRCSHAFHIQCIDTWLLSNSTCPLCRGTLLPVHENPVFYPLDPGDEPGFGDPLESQGSVGQKASSESGPGDDGEIQKRVFSVRLGKLRNVNVETLVVGEREEESSSLDSRRCFSMGSYQYVVGDSDLRVVALRPKKQDNSNSMRVLRGRGNNNNCGSSTKISLVGDGNCSEGNKIINIGSKGESFSQSKIWQWPRKAKFPTSSHQSHLSNSDFSLPSALKIHS